MAPPSTFTALPIIYSSALTSLVAALASSLILYLLLKTGFAWRLATDVPNHRSLHSVPTPRAGGWGIVPVALAAIATLAPALWIIGVCALALAVVSLIDDRRDLPARLRFTVHLLAVAAVLTVWHTGVPWWALGIIAFLMLWLVNLYNFMDGADGLAGGMTLFGFGAYAVAASLGPPSLAPLAWSCAAIAGAALGFLVFNFYPARIFLGDTGSITLGFLAGALGYWGWRAEAWPIWFPALVFAPFIVDASVTLLRRLARGERFWQAHREHYYQRMVRSGMGHAQTAVLWYAVMFAGIIVAICNLRCTPRVQWGIVFLWAVALMLMGIAIDRRWVRFQSTFNKPLKADDDV
ncbi:glycosyltransferase family 4 protein [Paraburkholderia silviterrae]|uniref:Glycosyltransferase family 4 protein n=1 Tax=Paraburkholderia silviterrae TaxID=2528715 RepID=A0A4R5LYL0_9BURK|nr:glycosyltransferase family 4 protein [Paraburkholderia silviterrae]TDG17397.1 glycosyltransferase family 4 protein [Paraburkholderia silviterrae]